MPSHAESEMSNNNPKSKHVVLCDLAAKQTLWSATFETLNDTKPN